jgi:branched-chain amino acid transport system permease protein
MSEIPRQPSAEQPGDPGHLAAATRYLRDVTRPRCVEFTLLVVPPVVLLAFPDRLLLATEIAILALFALSLDLILGYAGIVSLGHAAFFGFGAYTAGLLASAGWTEPLSGLLAAGHGSACLGFATSFLVLRGADLGRLMVTLGVAMVLGEIANRAAWLTGGADGLVGISMAPVFGLFEFDIFGRTGFLNAAIALLFLLALARLLMATRFGLRLRAIKGNRLRAQALGVNVERDLVTIYTLAAAYAGIAGGLLAQTTQFVSLDVLEFHRSAEVLLVLIIGGAGYLYGGLLGAVVFRLMQDWLAGLTPQYWLFWLGLLLVTLVLVSRNGLRGLLEQLTLAGRAQSRRRAGAGDGDAR